MNSIQQFFAWLRSYSPDAFSTVAKLRPETLRPDVEDIVIREGLGADSADPSAVTTDWGKTVSDAVQSLFTLSNQQKIIDLQIARAEKGLPPLNLDQLGMPVTVGLNSGTQSVLLLAIGAALVFAMVKR